MKETGKNVERKKKVKQNRDGTKTKTKDFWAEFCCGLK